jgi:hypothetical protein
LVFSLVEADVPCFGAAFGYRHHTTTQIGFRLPVLSGRQETNTGNPNGVGPADHTTLSGLCNRSKVMSTSSLSLIDNG